MHLIFFYRGYGSVSILYKQSFYFIWNIIDNRHYIPNKKIFKILSCRFLLRLPTEQAMGGRAQSTDPLLVGCMCVRRLK